MLKTANLTSFYICLPPHLTFNQYALKRNNEKVGALNQICLIAQTPVKHCVFYLQLGGIHSLLVRKQCEERKKCTPELDLVTEPDIISEWSGI